jgi:hypothetical protein
MIIVILFFFQEYFKFVNSIGSSFSRKAYQVKPAIFVVGAAEYNVLACTQFGVFAELSI